MDAQSSADASAALAALVQAVARLELSEGFAQPALMAAAEVLDENRFLAARDGMQARLIDPEAGVLMPARRQLDRLLAAARPHAQDLGCEAALAEVAVLAREGGAARQRAIAAGVGLEGVAETLAEVFLPAY
jgi:carboxylate-amine ligase